MKRAAGPMVRKTPIKRRRTNSSTSIARDVRALKGARDFYSTVVNTTPNLITVTYSGQAYSCLGSLTRGTAGKDSLTGASIKPQGLTIRVLWNRINSTDVCRFIVIQSIRGLAPSAANLLEVTGSINAPISNFNRGYKPQIRVLVDEMFTMTQDDGDARIFKYYVKGKKLLPVDFIPTNTTITTGDIVMYWYSSIITTGPTSRVHSELMFTD